MLDQRWERIRRPVVVVGGELTLEMLDLSFNPISKFYEAPIQMKAIGGVFVVDDFGRQRIPPRDLLNRWIVPLESRVDFLTLHTGRKFEVPFNVFIVFATNLKPESLADEAFLRRIPYKVLAKNPTRDEYCQIFEMNCRRRGLPFDPVMVEYLDRRYYQPRKLQMRACHPRDLVEQVVDICRYQKRELVITRESAGCSVRQLFPRRVRVAGSEGMKTVPVELPFSPSETVDYTVQTRQLTDLAARASIIVLFSLMAVRFAQDFFQTGHITGLFLLLSETLVVVLTVFRRDGIDRRSQRPRPHPDDAVDTRSAAAGTGRRGCAASGIDHRGDLVRRPRAS